VIPQTLVKREGQKSEGGWGKKRGGCVMAVVTRIALQHL